MSYLDGLGFKLYEHVCAFYKLKSDVHTFCVATWHCTHFYIKSVGAGKTSTFSILTGEQSPTEGTAIIAGYDIRTDIRKVCYIHTSIVLQ